MLSSARQTSSGIQESQGPFKSSHYPVIGHPWVLGIELGTVDNWSWTGCYTLSLP